MTESAEVKWYYADGGNRKGPISREDVQRLIQNGKITGATSMWSGDGDWMPAKDTEFSSLFVALPGVPPPLPGKDVDNKYIWAVVAVPIVGVIVEFFVGTELVWLYLTLNIVCCILDGRKLKASGHKAPEAGWAFLIPVYLWKRATLLHHNKRIYFWGWIAAFVLSILIGMKGHEAMLEESSIPLVSQILKDNFGSSAAECKAVDIKKEVSDGFYKATATLDNGKELEITIEEKEGNKIYVQVPFDQ